VKTAQTLIAHNVSRWNQLAESLRCTFPVGRFLTRRWFGGCDSVLDYGCGTGRAIKLLYDDLGVRDVWGCDTSARMCLLAQQSNPHATIVHALSPQSPPLIDHRFTRVLFVAMMSSIISEEGRLALLEATLPLLCRSGRVFVADFGSSTSREYRNRYARQRCEPTTFQTAEGLYIHHFIEGEIEKLLRRAGLAIVRSIRLRVTTMHGNRLPGYVVIGRVK
jgi:SAM-dependent methyltransferase